MYRNYSSFRDFLTVRTAVEGSKLRVFSKMDRYVRRFFQTDRMRKIMQYQLVFLGSSPFDTPALYNIMSHIDFNLGVYYPDGGMYRIVEALRRLGDKHGVRHHVDTAVTRIDVTDGRAVGITLADGRQAPADLVISNADIEHTKRTLLEKPHRSYSGRYWRTRRMAPSAFIMYLGVDGKIPTLTHHNLVFADDWKANLTAIFDRPSWPEDLSFYVCDPSVTDQTTAPAGKENLFVLVPIGAGVADDDAQRERYADLILETMEQEMDIPDLRARIEFKRIFGVRDFAARYNSLRGSALGLAHTMRQTAIWRPDTVSKKVAGLYYVGAGTNPGIGVPTCLISAELVYKRITGDTTAGPLRSLKRVKTSR